MHSARFPNINIPNLRTFACRTAAHEAKRRRDAFNLTGSSYPPSYGAHPVVERNEDMSWAGEDMIHITFESNSVPLGPSSLLAFFPTGRSEITTLSLVGMSRRMSDSQIRTPRIYGFLTSTDAIGAEVVLIEKVPGESLETLWPTLTPERKEKVVRSLADLLLGLSAIGSRTIASEQYPTGAESSTPSTAGRAFAPYLLSPPFNEVPLNQMEPQSALHNNQEYLKALAGRVQKVFQGIGPESTRRNLDARLPRCAEERTLTGDDVETIMRTWRRLDQLILYNVGGFYVAEDLSPARRKFVRAILNSQTFPVLHEDMHMARFIVEFDHSQPRGVSLTLTGWHHAHFAPTWSCARLPAWLNQEAKAVLPDGLNLSAEERTKYREIFHRTLWELADADDERAIVAIEWLVAHQYGVIERWFEHRLAAHWRDWKCVEDSLVDYKCWWEKMGLEEHFPIPVGEQQEVRHKKISEAIQLIGPTHTSDVMWFRDAVGGFPLEDPLASSSRITQPVMERLEFLRNNRLQETSRTR